MNEEAIKITPVDLLLYCPNCGAQHIDEAKPDICETCGNPGPECVCSTFTAWLNPPHKSHRCEFCNHVWMPADVPTNGVASLQSQGSRDSFQSPRVTTEDVLLLIEELQDQRKQPYADDGYINGLDYAIGRIVELSGINADLMSDGAKAKGETDDKRQD